MQPVTKLKLFGKRLGVFVLGAYWLVIFAGTHLPSYGVGTSQVNNKVKHFTAYFLLAGLMCYVTTSKRYVRRFGTIGLVGMTYGVIDEYTQRFVVGRSPDPMDFLADSAGLWSAIAIYAVAKSVHTRRLALKQFSHSAETERR